MGLFLKKENVGSSNFTSQKSQCKGLWNYGGASLLNRMTSLRGRCSNIGEVRSYISEVTAEWIEDYKPYLPEVAVEQWSRLKIKGLTSLKFQWSRSKMVNLISICSGADLHRWLILSLCIGNGADLSHQPYLSELWSIEDGESYLHLSTMEQI
ncbi:Leucine--tRNA ligase [Gossypium arboreum]|uniref:Leucine--tRNA ligase n=1 Tax=Gossypium arboreum TaxID=29729 RepID=A0A0B0N681_GOSAR|nr:Leucine--tRNA ligase [Gossypium arboreum]